MQNIVLQVIVFVAHTFFSVFHVNKFCMKVETDAELDPSKNESFRRKMFQNYTLFNKQPVPGS